MTAVHDTQRVLAQARASDDDDFFAVLLPEAAQLVIVAGHASPAMLTRKMRLGDGLVCDLLAELEDLDVVGPEKDDRSRVVLADPGRLDEVLARIADLTGGASEGGDEDDSGVDGVVPAVSLVKPDHHASAGDDAGASHDEDDWYDDAGDDWYDDEPGGELAIRPDDDLVPYQPGGLVAYQPERQHLVTRTLQATRRGRHWATHQPTLARGAAITRQAPRAGGRLIKWTPRGAKRAVLMIGSWVNDSRSSALLEKHSEAGEGEAYARVADARLKANLAGRRATVATVVSTLVLLGLAWWAPDVFAGALAALALAGGLALAVRHTGGELLWGLALAIGLAWLAWWQGPSLAGLVPQPPAWVWWALAAVLVVVCGLLGRQDDQKLVEMPATMAAHKAPPITAPMIVEALFRIGVAGMTMVAADRGMRDEIRVRAPGVGRAQHGWQIELELPPGITAGDVGEKREELAGALRRPLGCVWPSGGGDHPGHLRIYIGDKPMATALQAEWPLAAGQPIDIFDPFPLFTDEEGRWIDVTLLGTHAVVAGASGFGKSVTLRQLAVACALDPRTRLYVFDGKISGDLAPMQKVAHCYYEGGEPEDIDEQLAALQGIEKEMRRRARFLRGLPPEERSPKVTSALASQYPHLSPIILLVDEVQEYTEYGVKGSKDDKAIREAYVACLTRISRLGRSAGIAMVLVSQKPEASVIPTAIMGNCSIRVCHKVTEQNHNDQVLGTSAYKNGYNAALFSQEDRGLAWLRAEGDPRVVRSWSAMVDLDAAIELVDKAWALRKARGLLTGQAADDGVVEAEIVYDVVEDAEAVMNQHGCGKAQWGELVAMLRDFRPAQYADLSTKELSASVYRARPALRAKPRDVRSGGSVLKGVYISDLRKSGPDDDD